MNESKTNRVGTIDEKKMIIKEQTLKNNNPQNRLGYEPIKERSVVSYVNWLPKDELGEIYLIQSS